MKLYVGNLCYTMTETDLANLFTSYGSVLRVSLITDYYTRQSKCFGYVQMADRKQGYCAIRDLHGTRIIDRLLVVKEAQPKDVGYCHPW